MKEAQHPGPPPPHPHLPVSPRAQVGVRGRATDLVYPRGPHLGFGDVLQAKAAAASAPHPHIVHHHRPLRDDEAKLPHVPAPAGPRERSGPGGPASRRPTRAPRPRAGVPLHERCPKVASAGRAGSGWVLVGGHHQGAVCALVAQVQEALGADLGPAGCTGGTLTRAPREDARPTSSSLRVHSSLSTARRGPGTIGEVRC